MTCMTVHARMAGASSLVHARMAELVDALVSNTSGSNAVPVRSRLRVLFKTQKALIHKYIEAFLFVSAET
jgi:hypothetical protein